MTYSKISRCVKFSVLVFFCWQLTGQGERLVSLGTYVTQNLILLGLEKDLVGVTIHEPAEIKKNCQLIGTLWEPNIEKILTLKPDVVVASEEGNRPRSVNKLRQLKLEVLVLDQVYSFEDSCKNLRKLARRLHRQKQAEILINELKNQLQILRSTRPAEGPAVFFCLGFKPLVTAGRYSYLEKIIEDAGGKNIFSSVAGKYLTINLEEVIRRNPEVIISLEMEAESNPDFWNNFPDLKAVSNKRVFMVTNELFANPTPACYVQAVRYLRKLLFLSSGQGK